MPKQRCAKRSITGINLGLSDDEDGPDSLSKGPVSPTRRAPASSVPATSSRALGESVSELLGGGKDLMFGGGASRRTSRGGGLNISGLSGGDPLDMLKQQVAQRHTDDDQEELDFQRRLQEEMAAVGLAAADMESELKPSQTSMNLGADLEDGEDEWDESLENIMGDVLENTSAAAKKPPAKARLAQEPLRQQSSVKVGVSDDGGDDWDDSMEGILGDVLQNTSAAEPMKKPTPPARMAPATEAEERSPAHGEAVPPAFSESLAPPPGRQGLQADDEPGEPGAAPSQHPSTRQVSSKAGGADDGSVWSDSQELAEGACSGAGEAEEDSADSDVAGSRVGASAMSAMEAPEPPSHTRSPAVPGGFERPSPSQLSDKGGYSDDWDDGDEEPGEEVAKDSPGASHDGSDAALAAPQAHALQGIGSQIAMDTCINTKADEPLTVELDLDAKPRRRMMRARETLPKPATPGQADSDVDGRDSDTAAAEAAPAPNAGTCLPASPAAPTPPAAVAATSEGGSAVDDDWDDESVPEAPTSGEGEQDAALHCSEGATAPQVEDEAGGQAPASLSPLTVAAQDEPSAALPIAESAPTEAVAATAAEMSFPAAEVVGEPLTVDLQLPDRSRRRMAKAKAKAPAPEDIAGGAQATNEAAPSPSASGPFDVAAPGPPADSAPPADVSAIAEPVQPAQTPTRTPADSAPAPDGSPQAGPATTEPAQPAAPPPRAVSQTALETSVNNTMEEPFAVDLDISVKPRRRMMRARETLATPASPSRAVDAVEGVPAEPAESSAEHDANKQKERSVPLDEQQAPAAPAVSQQAAATPPEIAALDAAAPPRAAPPQQGTVLQLATLESGPVPSPLEATQPARSSAAAEHEPAAEQRPTPQPVAPTDAQPEGWLQPAPEVPQLMAIPRPTLELHPSALASPETEQVAAAQPAAASDAQQVTAAQPVAAAQPAAAAWPKAATPAQLTGVQQPAVDPQPATSPLVVSAKLGASPQPAHPLECSGVAREAAQPTLPSPCVLPHASAQEPAAAVMVRPLASAVQPACAVAVRAVDMSLPLSASVALQPATTAEQPAFSVALEAAEVASPLPVAAMSEPAEAMQQPAAATQPVVTQLEAPAALGAAVTLPTNSCGTLVEPRAAPKQQPAGTVVGEGATALSSAMQEVGSGLGVPIDAGTASHSAAPTVTDDIDVSCETNRWYDAFLLSVNPSQVVQKLGPPQLEALRQLQQRQHQQQYVPDGVAPPDPVTVDLEVVPKAKRRMASVAFRDSESRSASKTGSVLSQIDATTGPMAAEVAEGTEGPAGASGPQHVDGPGADGVAHPTQSAESVLVASLKGPPGFVDPSRSDSWMAVSPSPPFSSEPSEQTARPTASGAVSQVSAPVTHGGTALDERVLRSAALSAPGRSLVVNSQLCSWPSAQAPRNGAGALPPLLRGAGPLGPVSDLGRETHKHDVALSPPGSSLAVDGLPSCWPPTEAPRTASGTVPLGHGVVPLGQGSAQLIIPGRPPPLLPEVLAKPLAENVAGVGIQASWAAARCAGEVTGYMLEVNDGWESHFFDSSTALLTTDPAAARPVPADVFLVILRCIPKSVSLRLRVTAIANTGRGEPSPFSDIVTFSGPRLPDSPTKPMLEIIDGLGAQASAIHVTWAAARSAAYITGYALKAYMGRDPMYFDSCTAAFTADADAASPVPGEITSVILKGIPAGVSFRVEVAAVTELGLGKPSPLSDEVKLRLPEVPEAPPRPVADILDGGRVRVSWRQVSCRNRVTGYVLRVHGQAEILYFDSREEALVKDPVAARPLPPDTSTAILRALPAKISFKVDVLAINHAGRGDPSLPSLEFMLAEPGEPGRPAIEAADGMQLRVSWDSVCHSPPVTGYAVAMHDEHRLLYLDPRSGTLVDGPPEKLGAVPPGATSVVVDGLLPNIRYTAAVAALNEVGWGAYSPFSEAMELRRPQAPDQARVEICSAFSVRVSWEPPRRCAPGVLGYGVALAAGAGKAGGFMYFDAPSGKLTSSSSSAQPLDSDATSAVIGGLSAGVPYRAKVAALNSVGWSRYSVLSTSICIQAPPSPAQPEVVVLDDESVSVQWPQVDHLPEVSGYAVVIQDRTLRYFDCLTHRLVTDAASAKPVPGASTSVVVRGLNVGSKVWAKVAAENGAGWSPYSRLSEPITLGKPSVVAMPQLQVEGNGHLRVSWARCQSSGVTGYAVAVQRCGSQPSKKDPLLYFDPRSSQLVHDGWSVEALTPETTTVVIGGLSSKASYRAKIAAANVLGWGRYSPFSDVVRIREPDAPAAPKIRAVGATDARISWMKVCSVPAVTGYVVAVRYHSLRYYNWHSEELVPKAGMAAPTPADVISVLVRGLPVGVPCSAAVAALSDVGCSDYSAFSDALTFTGEEPQPWPPLRIDLSPNVPLPRTLLTSNYHVECGRSPPLQERDRSPSAVEKALQSTGRAWVLDCYQGFLKAGADCSEAVAALWLGCSATDAAPFFAEVNQVLLADDQQDLQAWMPIVRLLGDHLAKPEHCPAEFPLIAWRGSKLTRAQAASLCNGEVICPPMFVSSSLDRRVAEVFQDVFLVKMYVPKSLYGCGIISKEPSAPGEFILPPCTFLQVAEVRSDCVIEMRVLCGAERGFDPGNRARCFPI